MKIQTFVFNPFYENTYVVYDDSNQGIIIDPGCYEKYEEEELKDFISQQSLEIVAIVNTHCHIDHVLGNYAMKANYNCPLIIPVNELEIFRAVNAYAPQWGINGYTEAQHDQLLEASESISFGNTELSVISAPGHSPGHFLYYHEAEQKILGGDVLFRESIGRTDLPGGNHEDLIRNIQEKLYTLPEGTTIYPGHGPTTTIGHEKKHNPFVKAAS